MPSAHRTSPSPLPARHPSLVPPDRESDQVTPFDGRLLQDIAEGLAHAIAARDVAAACEGAHVVLDTPRYRAWLVRLTADQTYTLALRPGSPFGLAVAAGTLSHLASISVGTDNGAPPPVAFRSTGGAVAVLVCVPSADATAAAPPLVLVDRAPAAPPTAAASAGVVVHVGAAEWLGRRHLVSPGAARPPR